MKSISTTELITNVQQSTSIPPLPADKRREKLQHALMKVTDIKTYQDIKVASFEK